MDCSSFWRPPGSGLKVHSPPRAVIPHFIEGENPSIKSSLYVCTEPIRRASENRLLALLSLIIFTFEAPLTESEMQSEKPSVLLPPPTWPLGLQTYSIFHFQDFMHSAEVTSYKIRKKGTDCSCIADTFGMTNREQWRTKIHSLQFSVCHWWQHHYVMFQGQKNNFALLPEGVLN